MTGIRIKPKPKKEESYYAVLGVPPGSLLIDIHDRYLDLVRVHHPDVNGCEEEDTIRKINIAWSVLKDLERRRNYDMRLYLAGGQCARCEGKGLRRKLGRSKQVETVICPVCKGTGQKPGD